jgi:hypothetical protein
MDDHISSSLPSNQTYPKTISSTHRARMQKRKLIARPGPLLHRRIGKLLPAAPGRRCRSGRWPNGPHHSPRLLLPSTSSSSPLRVSASPRSASTIRSSRRAPSRTSPEMPDASASSSCSEAACHRQGRTSSPRARCSPSTSATSPPRPTSTASQQTSLTLALVPVRADEPLHIRPNFTPTELTNELI